MSKCISSHGEYSEHQLAETGNAEARFLCSWCFVLDEDALFAEFDALVAEVAELRGIIGRCTVRSGERVVSSRCTLPKDHRGAHQSNEHGFVVWSNADDPR